MTTAPTPFGVRYNRLRLDGDLDEFHHAQNALAADTCQGGRCTPQQFGRGASQCSKHERQAERRRNGGTP